MSGAGAPTSDNLTITPGIRVAIVAALWHEQVQTALVDNAVACAEKHQAQVKVVRVSGAFELPIVAQQLAQDHDAVVALATIVRGGTPHFDYVCNAVTDGLVRVSLDAATPIGFGVLTCDNDQQALDRSGLPGSSENKGWEAMEAALATVSTLRSL